MRVNNNVLILREAITKIVPMLTQRSVKVTQQGTRAYVAYSRKTHAIERVNLPYIPDDADDQLLAATQGFLDHEVGHILFTDQKAVVKAEKLGIHWLHNLVEDTYVERKMGERFPGSGGHLSRMHSFFLREYIDSQLREAPEQAKNILLVPAFRALAGQPAFIDYMADKWDQVGDVVDKLGKDFGKLLKGINSSWDSLKVAEEAKKRLSAPTPKPKAPPPAAPPEPPEPGMSGDESEPDEAAAGDPSGGSEPLSEAGPVEEQDREPTAESESGSSGAPEGEDIRDEPAPEGDGEQGDTDASSEAGEGADSAADEDQDDPSDDPSDEHGDGMLGGDAAQGEPSEDGEEQEQTENSSGETGASGAEGEDEGDAGEQGTMPAGGAPAENEEATTSLFDELNESPAPDFDEAAAEALSKNARTATKGSQYSLFSRDYDDVSLLEVDEGFNQDLVTRMQKEVDHMIGPLQKTLERAVAARSAAVWTGGHKTGRLHGPSLARISVGRSDVFRRKQTNKTKDVAVELLVDCSGSMWSHRKMVIAAYSAYALSSVLDQLSIPNEVLAFTTKDYPREALEQLVREEQEGGFVYTRRSALRLAIVKGFNERMTPDIRRRFAQLAHCDDMMAENVDGESVQIAARRLMQQRAERKILKVLSDGMPACNGMSAALNEHLKEVVRKVEASGVDVIGLGIVSDAVEAFYRSHVVLNDVKDLPTTVMKELHRLLLK
ncbi:cobaltochelatase CobT-related protein [Burkholderia sp. 22088]|uniref:cobaltochelatase CobT-related protein n=1 Tax=Burkholderia sp. 22088 TaxID=3453871 RepID=UPI003F864A25